MTRQKSTLFFQKEEEEEEKESPKLLMLTLTLNHITTVNVGKIFNF
jgi:hypothetical protein